MPDDQIFRRGLNADDRWPITASLLALPRPGGMAMFLLPFLRAGVGGLSRPQATPSNKWILTCDRRRRLDRGGVPNGGLFLEVDPRSTLNKGVRERRHRVAIGGHQADVLAVNRLDQIDQRQIFASFEHI